MLMRNILYIAPNYVKQGLYSENADQD